MVKLFAEYLDDLKTGVTIACVGIAAIVVTLAKLLILPFWWIAWLVRSALPKQSEEE